MKNDNIIVGLDIGTTKIACFIGQEADEGQIRILGFGKSDSIGVERGEVVNIVSTADSIKKAVREASNQAGRAVNEVWVGIAGQNIKSLTNQGQIMIPEDHKYIAKEDVEQLVADQYRYQLGAGEEIIHVFPQSFMVDNVPISTDPVGVSGKNLSATFHIVTSNRSNIDNIVSAVEEAGYKVRGLALEPVASAMAVLDDRDRDAGVVLVDIGGGTTDIAMFNEGVIVHTSVLPIAGKIITKDIKESCNILNNQAESLKVKFGSCLPAIVNEDDVVVIPGIRNQPPREISLKTLAGIIRARMKMILEQVGYEISLTNFDTQKLLAGLVLTGGGSKLKNVKDLAELTIKLNSRIGDPSEHLEPGHANTEEYSHPMYATGIGLVLYGIAQQNGEFASEEDTAVEEREPEPNTDEAKPENPFDIFANMDSEPAKAPTQPEPEPQPAPKKVKEPKAPKPPKEKKPKEPRNKPNWGSKISEYLNKLVSDPDA